MPGKPKTLRAKYHRDYALRNIFKGARMTVFMRAKISQAHKKPISLAKRADQNALDR